MQWDTQMIKKLITMMGFVPQNGKNGIYCKTYASHGGYMVLVDFNQRAITYDGDINPGDFVIKVWDRRTSNFSKMENFVVLECVDRLLEKGYAPSNIELEKTYPSGRGHSGKLDIFVRSEDGAPFLMVECKAWGTEYEKEKNKMLRDGGQLFSYYSNDRDAKYLCLYTSCMLEEVEYKNAIVDVEDSWSSLSRVKEIFAHWNKNIRDNGIFDSYAAPYNVKHKALTYGKLKTLKEEDSGKIYNQIMEILRHNAISDKPNAFNKLLNLFVCKIIDEDKNPEDELEFQWLETEQGIPNCCRQ
ncbi:MAG: type I restriction enzyme HsdR N-terminal domain-containing protein [Lachnospiraceae bacterium]|nr:type I restriction enzyme HsdR N-terminal domain-containing protein [Lachnospiraceae bacterium]